MASRARPRRAAGGTRQDLLGRPAQQLSGDSPFGDTDHAGTDHPAAEPVERALGLVREGKRPVISVGHGARLHMDAITALAEQVKAPVI